MVFLHSSVYFDGLFLVDMYFLLPVFSLVFYFTLLVHSFSIDPIPYNQLSLADFFRIARKFMNPASLSSSLFSTNTLTLTKLSLLPFGNISMYPRADPVNTLCMPFYGHSSSSVFFYPNEFPPDSSCGRMVYLYPEKICELIRVHYVARRNGIHKLHLPALNTFYNHFAY